MQPSWDLTVPERWLRLADTTLGKIVENHDSAGGACGYTWSVGAYRAFPQRALASQVIAEKRRRDPWAALHWLVRLQEDASRSKWFGESVLRLSLAAP
jgi:hypothetical protein